MPGILAHASFGALLTLAAQDDTRLPGLFDRLLRPLAETEAQKLQEQVWEIWLEHRDPAIQALIQRGAAAMSVGAFDPAMAAFDAVIARAPDFAEGWNKRATLHFLMGDYAASVADIEHTLRLEPHHWGALAGLGQIYMGLGRKDAAVRAFERALAINPHLSGVKSMLEQVRGQAL